MTASMRPTISGVAVVCCVHDREKRQIRSEAQVAGLASLVGAAYDPSQHKLFDCACCQNLFVAFGDEPSYCHECRKTLVHQPAAALPDPTGRL